MSLIFRQSLKSSIYSYVGVIIGFTTTAILMPRFLTTSEIGTIRQVQYYSMLIASIMAFGLPLSIIKMFPYFNDIKNHHNGFLKFILLIGVGSSIIFSFLFLISAEWFLLSDIENSELFAKYYYLILPYSIAALFFVILDQYSTAIKESTIGIFAKDIGLRTFLLILIALFTYSFLDYDYLVKGFTYVQFIPVLLLILFLLYKKQFLLGGGFISSVPDRFKEFITVAGFGWISGLGAIIVESTDSIMLSKLSGSSQVGIYTTVFYFASLLRIPSRALSKISSSLTAEHFKTGNLPAIHSIYKKSAVTQLIASLFLYFNLILFIPFIFDVILKPEFSAGKWVLVLIGLSNVIKMGTGIKFVIIFNSDKYKWNTIFLFGFSILLIGTNYWLIPIYGMTGAALATLISVSLYHISGMAFLWHFYKFNPITGKLVLLSSVSSVLFLGVYLLPSFLPFLAMPILKVLIFSIAFIIIVLKYNFSPDLNEQIKKVIKF